MCIYIYYTIIIILLLIFAIVHEQHTPTHDVFQFIFLFMLQKICIGDGCHVEDIYIQHLEVKHVSN